MRRTTAVCSSLVIAVSVASAAAAAAPGAGRLAARIAPTAADLGPGYRHESAAEVHARSSPCPARTSGCAWRYFGRTSDPPGIPSAVVFVDVFPTVAQARATYDVRMRRLTRQTTPPRSVTHLTVDGARATFVVSRVTLRVPVRTTETYRSILLREGRADVFVGYKPGRTVAFAATARRLAARLRPARR